MGNSISATFRGRGTSYLLGKTNRYIITFALIRGGTNILAYSCTQARGLYSYATPANPKVSRLEHRYDMHNNYNYFYV